MKTMWELIAADLPKANKHTLSLVAARGSRAGELVTSHSCIDSSLTNTPFEQNTKQKNRGAIDGTMVEPYTSCDDDNLRCAADGGVSFSSTKCPPPNTNPRSNRLEQTCELPFGFIYTPMIKITQQLMTSISLTNLPAGAICTKCLTYLNLYCETTDIFFDATKENAMMKWRCELCKSENIVSVENNSIDVEKQGTASVFDAIMSQRVVEFCQPLTPQLGNHSGTGATANAKYLKTIVLVVDENIPPVELLAIGNVLRSELSQNPKGSNFYWQVGLIVFGKSISIYKLGIASGIVAADVVRSHEGFEILFDSQSDVLRHSYLGASVETLVSCLTSQSCANQNSSNDCNYNADVVRTNENIPKKTRLQILKERKQSRLQSQENGYESSHSIGTNSRSDFSNSLWTPARERIAKSKPPCRCTSDAVLCAVDLASLGASSFRSTETTCETASRYHDSRILLFTNGCPNVGEGSVVDTRSDVTGASAAYNTVDSIQLAHACRFYNVIGKAAVDVGVGIDVFCTGSSELGFPAYLSLVEASAGYVISHDTFESSRLQFNLGHVLLETHMSRTSFHAQSEDRLDAIDLLESSQILDDGFSNGCTVDLRMSSYLTSTHLIGPGDLVDCPSKPLKNEQVAFTDGLNLAENNQLIAGRNYPSTDTLTSTLIRIQLGRYDPLSTFSVMLRANDQYQGEQHAFFQFIVRFVDISSQSLVTRISTHRLSVANAVGEFLETIDEEVVPVLLAKEAVYRSMFGRYVETDHPSYTAYKDELGIYAHDAQEDLDNTVFLISGAFRLLNLVQGTKSIDLTEENGVKAAASSMDFAFPPELSDALRRLYHLRRGPLLCPGPVQSADDRAEMRSCFVRFPLRDCLTMMAPSLWSCVSLVESLKSHSLALQNVPPETLALWENQVIAADHWNNMFIWSGSETSIPTFNIIREQLLMFLNERSKTRFPKPNIHVLNRVDPMSRRFTSLLAPSHGDPVEHQLAHFHALTTLTKDELKKLHDQFPFYDPNSDPSFRKWFWEVAGAATTVGRKGISLCD